MKTDDRDPSSEADVAMATGIRALEFLAGDPVLFHRFLDLTGMEVGQLRAATRQPAFFAGLLDFLLGHEPTLLAFAQASGLAPEAVVAARAALGNAFGPESR